MDADGAIWTGVGPFDDNLVGRVREGGEVLERVRLDMPCFACMLGGEDRRTLFMLTADWRMNESFERQHRSADRRTTHRPAADRARPRPGRRMAVTEGVPQAPRDSATRRTQ